jgi:hypothetical protein
MAVRTGSRRITVLAVPDDELHREILLPLLPAMLGDKAIRQGWREGLAGFFSRVRLHIEGDGPAPRWLPHDFEIPVASSYLAGPDAKALADALLSEPSLRDLAAALMNRVLENVWTRLPVAAPSSAEPGATEVPELVEPTRIAPEPGAEPPARSAKSTSPAILVTGQRRNPIRGVHHTFGGLASRSPFVRNPLRRVWPLRDLFR